MANLKDLTTHQIQRIIDLKEQIESLQSQVDAIIDGGEIPVPFFKGAKLRKKHKMSAAGRAAIAAAARKRWAKLRGGKVAKSAKPPGRKSDRRMSPAVKKKLAAIARARWAKAKAAGKKGL